MTTIHYFILINLIGGIFVIGSYILGFNSELEDKLALWGGITGKTRQLFTISMLLSATGYLTFLFYMIFKGGLDNNDNPTFIGLNIFLILSVIFLLSASIWMPATVKFLETSLNYWWVITVIVLWITAISLMTMLITLIYTNNLEHNISLNLATIGIGYITFHCLVLDAIIWVFKFPK
ncbi:MAG: hypothetical protein ACJ0A6_02400 [Dehalococcoidia bacterium]